MERIKDKSAMKQKKQCRWQEGEGVGWEQGCPAWGTAVHSGERPLQSHTLVAFVQQGGEDVVYLCVS